MVERICEASGLQVVGYKGIKVDRESKMVSIMESGTAGRPPDGAFNSSRHDFAKETMVGVEISRINVGYSWMRV
jgi:hypothetical protein